MHKISDGIKAPYHVYFEKEKVELGGNIPVKKESFKMLKYEIKENPFHGGRHVQYARSAETAFRAIKRLESKGCHSGNCSCGGLAVVFSDGHKSTQEEKEQLEKACFKVYNM